MSANERFQVKGISCLDCAAEFERNVQALGSVEKAQLNTITGELTIVGEVDIKDIKRLGKVEDYEILRLSDDNRRVFQIEGISCLDCAGEFEKEVQALEGVEKAVLNMMTGELIVEGTVDIEQIRKLGSVESYNITEGSQGIILPAHTSKGDLYRAAGAAALWSLGFILSWQELGLASTIAYASAILIGGWSNFSKAYRALLSLKFNMAVLMTVAVTGAALMGEWQEGAAVAALFSLAEYLEEWSVEQGRRALSTLMSLSPVTARKLIGQEEEEVVVESVQPGDIIRIRPGDQIPLDGVILSGQSAVNQAAITGEPLPVEKQPGDGVFAGTLNTHGVLDVEVQKAAKDTTLSRIIRMVAEAQSERAPVEQMVEKFASKYTPIVLVIAAVIAVAPPLLWNGDWHASIYQALALLVVACPCALVISTPVAIISAVANGAKQGVLVKAGAFLEAAASVKVLALDKTGTLTAGKPKIIGVQTTSEISVEELLMRLGGLEKQSEHPLALAVVEDTQKRGLTVSEAKNVFAVPGKGIQGEIDGKTYQAGNRTWMLEMQVALPEDLTIHPESTPVWLVSDGKLLGLVEIADPLRLESVGVVRELKEMGIQPVLLTGDRKETADALAAEAGISEVRAELLPADKLTAITELLKSHSKVGMIGDGINDAPALAMSTLGIAMGGGTDTAMETADVVLMDGSLTKLPFLFRLSRSALKIIRQNITLSIALKLVAIIAAFFGILTLWFAILADVGATLLVTLNSLRLLRYQGNK